MNPLLRRLGLVRRTGTACASEAAAVSPGVATTSLATLLTSHILRDGELVILILRPSLWFILCSSLPFLGAVLLAMIAAKVFDPQLPGPNRNYVEVGSLIIAARLVWATMQWSSRLYILTDLRILSLSGVFTIDVFDCPLRKVARTRMVRPVPERLLAVGTIEVVPQDESAPFGLWQTIPRPDLVHDQVLATIRRAKSGCGGM